MYNILEKHFFYKESDEKTSFIILEKYYRTILYNHTPSFERNDVSCYNHKQYRGALP